VAALDFLDQRVEVAEVGASAATPMTRSPRSAAVASSRERSRPVMTTCAPSAAKRRAAARPMPLVPPVISATLSVNRLIVW
jgi:hypothetical protein